MNFKSSFNFYKEIRWDSDTDCVESVYQFGEYYHFNNVKLSYSWTWALFCDILKKVFIHSTNIYWATRVCCAYGIYHVSQAFFYVGSFLWVLVPENPLTSFRSFLKHTLSVGPSLHYPIHYLHLLSLCPTLFYFLTIVIIYYIFLFFYFSKS